MKMGNQEDVKIMHRANVLIKQNKIAFDSNEEKLIWIYYPKLFKKLNKICVPTKIRSIKHEKS